MAKLSSLKGKVNTTKPSFLFKSPPGHGKTVAAASATLVFGKMWLAYFDKKEPLELIKFYENSRPEVLDLIDFESYGSHNAGDYLEQLRDWAKHGGCPYDVICTDGVTSLTSAAINWSLLFDESTRSGDKPKLPDFDDYKVETVMVTQALDICKSLDVVNIWTAHPVPRIAIEADGTKVKAIKKTNTIVSYGNKVGALVPGAFHEIYHFAQQGSSRFVYTDTVGDETAKNTFNLPRRIDITGKLFFPEWQRLVDENKGANPLERKQESSQQSTAIDKKPWQK